MAERDKLLLTYEEVAVLTGISFYTIEKLTEAGLLKTRRIPETRGRYISRTDLQEWLDALPVREPAFIPPVIIQ